MLESEIEASEDFQHFKYVRGYYLTDQAPLSLGVHWLTKPLGDYAFSWDA